MAGLQTAPAVSAGLPGAPQPLLDALVEALPLGVLLQAADRRVLRVNTEFLRLAGISARPAELIGVTLDESAQHVLDLFELGRPTGPAAPGAAAAPRPAAAGGLAATGGLGEPGTPGEPERIVERECVPLETGGQLLGQLWVLRDVTDQAAARRAAVEQDRLLAELAALRSDFVATVSHELRTPLTSIVGLSTLLLDGDERLDAEQTECLQAIERSADRLLRLADDLTLLAGLESQRLALRAELLELPELARQRTPGWQQTAAAAGVTLCVDCADSGPPVRGDERLLARMLDDLVSTAVTASPAGGQVNLSVQPVAGGWVVEITDPTPPAADGPAEPDPPTTPHSAGATSSAAPSGSAAAGGSGATGGSRHGLGLGLGPALGRAIAKRHHGSMAELGGSGGSIIRVQLPAADTATAPGD